MLGQEILADQEGWFEQDALAGQCRRPQHARVCGDQVAAELERGQAMGTLKTLPRSRRFAAALLAAMIAAAMALLTALLVRRAGTLPVTGGGTHRTRRLSARS